MKLVNTQTQIKILENRIALMKTRGEQERAGLIAKCRRQIRKLQQQNNI